MKTARFYGIHDIRFEELNQPVCGSDEIRIRVAWAGICGSDLHIYHKGMFIQNIPETMGHEFVGIVESTGSEVQGFVPGDVVIADPMVPCMNCDSCRSGSYNTCSNLGFIGEVRQGCFAEWIVLKAEKVIKVPARQEDLISTGRLRQLALSEPLAVALNLCERADLQREDDLAIIGAGPIGLLVLLGARILYEVRKITVVNRSEPRLHLAGSLGASELFRELPSDRRFGKVVEAAGGVSSFRTAMDHVASNGSVYVVSIFEELPEMDLNELVAGQISLVGCNVYERRHLEQAAFLIASGRINVDPLITGDYDLSQCAEAFEALSSKNAAKILFRMES